MSINKKPKLMTNNTFGRLENYLADVRGGFNEKFHFQNLQGEWIVNVGISIREELRSYIY